MSDGETQLRDRFTALYRDMTNEQLIMQSIIVFINAFLEKDIQIEALKTQLVKRVIGG